MAGLEIPRQRLHNQGIAPAAFSNPVDVVGWLAAVQAQDFSGAKWALGMRMLPATDQEVERVFNDGAFLRTHLLRPTWHFVTPADIRWLLALTGPRVQAANASMHRKLEVDRGLLERSSAALAESLKGRQLTRDELRTALEEAGIAVGSGQRLAYLLMQAELEGLICSGARRGRQFTYALLEERVPFVQPLSREDALAELARRYFLSRGPATEYDFAKWSGLTLADARNGLEAVRPLLQNEKVGGQEYWFPGSARFAKDPSPTAYLLSVYDEYISGYRDRSAIGDNGGANKLWAMGNALSYLILIDGQIVGSWKRTLKKGEVSIDANVFKEQNEAEKGAVEAAAGRYGAFLGLPVVAVEMKKG